VYIFLDLASGMKLVDDPRVVIATTWRLDLPLAALIEKLDPLGRYMKGVTPEINRAFVKYVRQLYILLMRAKASISYGLRLMIAQHYSFSSRRIRCFFR
jgi:hypothetical protein